MFNRCEQVKRSWCAILLSFDLGHYLRRACGGPFSALVTVSAVPVAVPS